MLIKRKIILLAILSAILIAILIGINLTPDNWKYFLSRRIPKVIATMLTAGAIAFSSMVFQTITNNRILTPSVLGLDSLYLLIQTMIIFLFGQSSIVFANNNYSFIISVSLMVIFSMILFKALLNKGNNIFFLLLTGLIFGTLFSSISTFMQVLIDPNEFLVIQDKKCLAWF